MLKALLSTRQARSGGGGEEKKGEKKKNLLIQERCDKDEVVRASF